MLSKTLYHRYLIGLMSLCLSGLSAQTLQDEDVYQGELNKMTQIPVAPEAAAFAKYGDTDVSLYTGTPNVSVPLYVFQGREFNLPFQLSYDASGVKVEQAASQVGLSWSLQAGGRITRQVNGLPDDYFFGNYSTFFNDATVKMEMDEYLTVPGIFGNPEFESITQAQNYVFFLYDINMNNIETQPDVFKVNAGNLNASIVVDYSQSPAVAKALGNPRIKVEPTISTPTALTKHISSWTITDEDGTQYHFQAQDTTWRQNLNASTGAGLMGDANVKYISSWHLTQIESANQKDTYDFTYKDEGWLQADQLAGSAGSIMTDIQNNITYYPFSGGSVITSSVVSFSSPLYLTSISHNGSLIADFIYGDRYDLDTNTSNSRLVSIDFYDPLSTPVIQSVVFDNEDYFNRDGQTLSSLEAHTSKTYYDIRLKLNGVEIQDDSGDEYKTFTFEYENPDGLPSRLNNNQDFFGYYNGTGNNTLYPQIEYAGLTFEGGDREPDSNSSRIGLLTKVTYPTKGYSLFEYETHRVYTSEANQTTLTPLTMGLGAGGPETPELYRDDNGLVCDDQFLYHDLKIEIQSFFVTESGSYHVNYSGHPAFTDAFIVDPSLGTEDYSNYCEFYNDNNALWIQASPYTTITLETGKTYKALLLLAADPITGQYTPTTLSLTKDTVTSSYINKDMGGNRIASISDYSHNDSLALKKEYDYGKIQSNGVLNYVPKLYEIRTGHTETGEVNQLLRYATFGTGDEPHVVYSKVVEKRVNASNVALGLTEYQFFNGSNGNVPMTTPPYESNYFPNLRPGNVREKRIMEAGVMVSRDSTDYFETVVRPIQVKSLVVYTDEERFEKLVFLKESETDPQDPNYYVTLEYLPAFDCDAPPTPDHPGLCILPSYISNPQGHGYHSFMDAKYAPYRLRTGFVNGAYGGVSFTRNEQSFENEANPGIRDIMVTESETVYDDYSTGTLYLPAYTLITDSKGRTSKTEYTYPHQLQAPGSSYLVNQNNLREITNTLTTLDPDGPSPLTVNSLSREYIQLGSAVLPETLKRAKGNQTEETVLELTYYPDGNIKTSKRPNGPTTHYIWGYSGQLPIAKIDNLDAASASTVQSYINAAVASADLDNDHCTSPSCKEQILRDSLASLRNNLPTGAMMTGYTHDPQVGVTSISDARGYTTYFEYDGLNRLLNTKDDELNLLSEYKYHYKGQN